LIRTIQSEHKGTFSLAFQPDTYHLAIAYVESLIEIVDISSGEIVRELSSPGVIRTLFNVAGDRLIAGHAGGDCSVHNCTDGQQLVKFKAHEPSLYDCALSPDGTQLATVGGDGMLKTWNWKTGDLIRQMEVGNRWINCVAYSPDGRRLICGAEDTMTFWETATGREISSLSLEGCAHHVTFSSDGSTLAMAGENPRIDVWKKQVD